MKQVKISDYISDPTKRKLSIISAYFFIQHMYVKQIEKDSVELYQNMLEKFLKECDLDQGVYYLSSLYADRGLLYKNMGRLEEAAEQLDKSLSLIENSSNPFLFYPLQIYGDLEIVRKDTAKAITYYEKALQNSILLSVNHKSMYLHKRISDILMNNEETANEAKIHLREYNIINDSLENHNKRVVDAIMSGIIKEKNEDSHQRSNIFKYIVIGLIFVSIIISSFLIAINRRHKKKLTKKEKVLISNTDKIGLLEKKLENNIFNDIIELAKSNSPEFLPLFGQGYPEFIAAMKQLDPTIRSSELYFTALAYLNFSTKDIAEYTFVTTRAVQVRRNRMRKKYNIPSEVDFNEWIRELVKEKDSVDEKIKE